MEHLVNFRDLGGMRSVDGGRVKVKRILRSGEVVNLGAADTDVLLREYNLMQIIDFRGSSECRKKPDDEITDVKYLNIDIMKGMKQDTGFDSLASGFNMTHADESMKSVYRGIVLDNTAQAGYLSFIRALLEQQEGASLFHCFAGKDRTGIGAAIVLTMLGVTKDDIFDDYLQTNEQRKAANQIILDDARMKGYNAQQLEGLESLMSVKAEYLEAAYDTIRTHYGSFISYIETGLGINKSEIEQFRTLYLE